MCVCGKNWFTWKTGCVYVVVVVVVVVVVDPKLLSSSLLYSQCQADESACLSSWSSCS